MTRKPGEPLKFLLSIIESDTDECIIWPYGKLSDGYGYVNYNGRQWKAHRLVCLFAYGNPPLGSKSDAAHGPCNDRACVAPKHLRWATRQENLADRHRDGTYPRHGGHRTLNQNDVQRIRTAYAKKEASLRELARLYKTTAPNISHVVNYKSWNSVP